MIIGERYQMGDRLGEGGTAITYKAVDLKTSQEVAIKVLSLDNVDWKQADLFERREVKILRQLNHPRIPQYIDYFVSDNEDNFYFPILSQKSLQDFVEAGILLKKFYLVQELVPGKNLVEWRENINKVNEKEVKNIAIQVLNILVYLQSLAVVHRDIKPQNIIYTDKKEIFLVDFGAVHNAYYNTMMGETVGIGTIGYMSPEQQIGRPVPASDLYSLGRTLLYLLTRRPPDHLLPHKETVDLEVIRDYIQLSDEFIGWLEKILEPDVDERFFSAKEALKALKNPRLVKQGKLSKIRWFTWLGLGVASVAIANFSYNYRWAILTTLGFPAPLGVCNEKDITMEYLRSGGKVPNSDINQCFLNILDDGLSYNDPDVALIEAVRQKHKDIVEFLLDYGIDVNVQEKSRFTAIGSAILTGQKDLVELLIERGADIKTIDTSASLSGSMLHEAVYNAGTKKETSNNHEDIVTILLNLGLDVNSRDKEGSTPLHYAAVRGKYLHGREPYTSMIELLIANGADVNIRNIYGQTPLHLAVIWDGMGARGSRFGDLKNAIEVLIANGANVNVRDQEGKTPLAHAKERGNKMIMELLKKHGAR